MWPPSLKIILWQTLTFSQLQKSNIDHNSPQSPLGESDREFQGLPASPAAALWLFAMGRWKLGSHSAISHWSLSQVNMPPDPVSYWQLIHLFVWGNILAVYLHRPTEFIWPLPCLLESLAQVWKHFWCLQTARKGINWTPLLWLSNSRVLPYSLVIKWSHLCPTWLLAFDLRTFD